MAFGVTFSDKYAQELGLDWREVYEATLVDLEVRKLRIPIYWDQVEPIRGQYVFDDVDYMIERAEEVGAEVVLAVGMRVPRWPECHTPVWMYGFDPEQVRHAFVPYLNTVIERYKNSDAVVAWQVENEPFLGTFGECPPFDQEFFEQELELVRRLDPTRPLVITESGELSTWARAAGMADVIGVSMYRVTWNEFLGYFYYPLPPAFYRYKAELLEQSGTRVVVSELQAEPWGTGPLIGMPLAEQFTSMDLERLRHNISFVRQAGFGEAYLWGVEWWYWLRTLGDDRFWEYARTLY